jgi:HSP90 family molecular chaperone
MQGYEVVYFTDALDEYLTQHLPSYEDHTFANIAKEDLTLAKVGGVW